MFFLSVYYSVESGNFFKKIPHKGTSDIRGQFPLPARNRILPLYSSSTAPRCPGSEPQKSCLRRPSLLCPPCIFFLVLSIQSCCCHGSRGKQDQDCRCHDQSFHVSPHAEAQNCRLKNKPSGLFFNLPPLPAPESKFSIAQFHGGLHLSAVFPPHSDKKGRLTPPFTHVIPVPSSGSPGMDCPRPGCSAECPS